MRKIESSQHYWRWDIGRDVDMLSLSVHTPTEIHPLLVDLEMQGFFTI